MMNKTNRTPDGGSIGFITDEHPIWAEGKSFYDSYTFVNLADNLIVAYASDKFLISIPENIELEGIDGNLHVSHCIFARKRFIRNKKLPSL